MIKTGFKIILINIFMFFCFLPSVNASLSSTFDSGDEGWGVWASDPLDVTNFQWNNTGGNPGGYISAIDGEQAATWWFQSPSVWAGDWTQYIGGSIEWDILLMSAPNLVYFENSEIIIDASDTGNYLLGEVDINPILNQWVHFSIDLIPGNFTQAGTRDFNDIIANVDSILIRGEFITGSDSEGLDNVFVSQVPIPGAIWLFGSGLIGLIGFKKKLKE
jgi:alkaline phosphatase D